MEIVHLVKMFVGKLWTVEITSVWVNAIEVNVIHAQKKLKLRVRVVRRQSQSHAELKDRLVGRAVTVCARKWYNT